MSKYLPTYYQLIPENIYNNLTEIEDILKPKIKGYSSDNLKQVISIVAFKTRKNNGRSQIQMAYIQKMVAQGYKYLKGLIDLNIIQRTGRPIKGQTSYQYNFAPDYLSKYISLPLNNAKLILRIEKVHSKSVSKSVYGYSEQVKYLKQLTIVCDYKKYLKTITETNKYNSILSSATRILNGNITYSVDNTSGRFHSNITNMKKELRKFLRVNGEQLVNIDIKNSQPFLSTILLTNPKKVAHFTNNRAFSMFLQTLKVSNNEDVKKYISLVVSGQIYEYLMKVFKDNGLILTRSETKRQMLRIIYARNRSPKNEVNRKVRRLFINEFPTVHKTFSKIRGTKTGDKYTNFKRFSILLQTIESHLLLKVILKRINEDLPDTITITIHDSIMTGILTNRANEVREIMTDELTKFIGFRPIISFEGVGGVGEVVKSKSIL